MGTSELSGKPNKMLVGNPEMDYRKIPIISLRLISVQKAFLLGI